MEETEMSLLTEMSDNCVMLDRKTTADGYGGYYSTYVDGAPFKAAISTDASPEILVAEKSGSVSKYTVLTDKSIVLNYHDVFYRVKDHKVFRVTADGDDRYTPKSSALNKRAVTAEEWVIPNG